MQRTSSNRSGSASMQSTGKLAAGQGGSHGKAGLDDGPVEMPDFLRLNRKDVRTQFEDITWKERQRIARGYESPGEFSRVPAEGSNIRSLDRYCNVYPYAGNRIRLNTPPGHHDYINASPIIVQSPTTGVTTRYIAMQGPKQRSVHHMWRMVWEETDSPAVIVMLTETHQNGIEACYPYYPASPTSAALPVNPDNEFSDGFRATVTCESLETAPGVGANSIEIRRLRMDVVGKSDPKIIWHLLFKRWPDFGVPAGRTDIEAFFNLMALSRSYNMAPHNPRIIHCSAGVGRSGTFIALEHLVSELEAGRFDGADTNKHDDSETGYDSRSNAAATRAQDGDGESGILLHIDDPVFSTVDSLRRQRPLMVQSEKQFQFVYEQLRRLWEERHRSRVSGSGSTRLGLLRDEGGEDGDASERDVFI